MERQFSLYDLMMYVIPGLPVPAAILWRWKDPVVEWMRTMQDESWAQNAALFSLALLGAYVCGHALQHVGAAFETMMQRVRRGYDKQSRRATWWYLRQTYIDPPNWQPELLVYVKRKMREQLLPEGHTQTTDAFLPEGLTQTTDAFLALACHTMLDERRRSRSYQHHWHAAWMCRGLAVSLVPCILIVLVCNWSLPYIVSAGAMLLAVPLLALRCVQFYAQAWDHVFRECLLLLHRPQWGLGAEGGPDKAEG